MKNLVFAAALLVGLVAKASSAEHGGGHEEGGIPVQQIIWQAVNLGILLVAIFFLIRKSIVETFAKRQADYLAQTEKTKALMKEAESSLADIKQRMLLLEQGEAKAMETAKAEAQLLSANIVKDAQVAAEKLKKDAELTINNELNRAKAEINQAILTQAIGLAAQKISGSAANQEAAFVKQLEQVRP